eukprot:gene22074-biopygen16226
MGYPAPLPWPQGASRAFGRVAAAAPGGAARAPPGGCCQALRGRDRRMEGAGQNSGIGTPNPCRQFRRAVLGTGGAVGPSGEDPTGITGGGGAGMARAWPVTPGGGRIRWSPQGGRGGGGGGALWLERRLRRRRPLGQREERPPPRPARVRFFESYHAAHVRSAPAVAFPQLVRCGAERIGGGNAIAAQSQSKKKLIRCAEAQHVRTTATRSGFVTDVGSFLTTEPWPLGDPGNRGRRWDERELEGSVVTTGPPSHSFFLLALNWRKGRVSR